MHLIVTNCILRHVMHTEMYAEPCKTTKIEVYEKRITGTLIAVIAHRSLIDRKRV